MRYYVLNVDPVGINLRYCLESLKRHNPKAEVVVVGIAPSWYTGEHITAKRKNNKGADIAEKIKAAADHAQGEFVLVSDDHFFNSAESTTTQYHTKLMTEVSAEEYPAVFASLVRRDGHELKSKGYDCINYGSHSPIFTSTNEVKAAAKIFDLHRVGAKPAILNIAGGRKSVEIAEPKLREKKTKAELKKLPFFSLSPLVNVYDELDAILAEPIKPQSKPTKAKSAPKKAENAPKKRNAAPKKKTK